MKNIFGQFYFCLLLFVSRRLALQNKISNLQKKYEISYWNIQGRVIDCIFLLCLSITTTHYMDEGESLKFAAHINLVNIIT